ncbi:MAG TPA: flagellar assembly protein FliW [Bacillota bacterium]|nr:flagellar assembly protein FliW [Bacillota bacterium]
MKLQTKYVGAVDVKEEKIINFPFGLPGFEKETSFVLLELPGNPIFQTLQSVTNENLAFIVIHPYHLYKDYEFKLDQTIQDHLKIQEQADVFVLTIVTLKQPFEQSTINLKAPIIINEKEMLAKQYVLVDDAYETKAPLHVETDEDESKDART